MRRREERQRGGEGEGEFYLGTYARIRTPLLSSTTTTNARTTTRSFLCRPVLGNNLHRLFVPLSALSRNKERISFFPPIVWEKKKKGKEREREGRKKGETNFSNYDRRRSIFPSASMCVSVSSSINGSWPAIDLAGE